MEKIILNDGTKDIEFDLLDTFGVEDKEYAALLSEDEEIYIMEFEVDGEDAVFKTIENKKEFDEILALYIELLDELGEEQ
ncbi:MAG: DUF1292 domain-containing protein [Tissierellia bacterium]|nr:DUF1292 domain-containing protein [Tissierellia bacterium]